MPGTSEPDVYTNGAYCIEAVIEAGIEAAFQLPMYRQSILFS